MSDAGGAPREGQGRRHHDLGELLETSFAGDALHCKRRRVAAINAGSGDWCLALNAFVVSSTSASSAVTLVQADAYRC